MGNPSRAVAATILFCIFATRTITCDEVTSIACNARIVINDKELRSALISQLSTFLVQPPQRSMECQVERSQAKQAAWSSEIRWKVSSALSVGRSLAAMPA